MHLILRFPITGAPLFWIVDQHKNGLQRRIGVWFGIRTCFFRRALMVALQKQIRNGIPTYLWLLQRSGQSFIGVRGLMADLSNSPDSAAHVPDYYREQGLLPEMKGWVKIVAFEEMAFPELEGLRLCTTGNLLIDVLKKSMLSFGAVYSER